MTIATKTGIKASRWQVSGIWFLVYLVSGIWLGIWYLVSGIQLAGARNLAEGQLELAVLAVAGSRS